MNMSQIKMSYEYGETPPNFVDDHDWIREHEQELLATYGECSILVFHQMVVGVGETYNASIEDAKSKLSTDSQEVITPVHVWLHHRQPFYRVLPGNIERPKQD